MVRYTRRLKNSFIQLGDCRWRGIRSLYGAAGDARYDVVVIGGGMIGSAAGKYLSRLPGWRVAVIGATVDVEDCFLKKTESAESLSGVTRLPVYSSHFDEGRVQRIIGADPTWTRLNIASALAYSELENISGIKFHHPVGCLYASTYDYDTYLDNLHVNAEGFGRVAEIEDPMNSQRPQYRHFSFPAGCKACYEDAPSGYINPLKLIQAQLSECRRLDSTVINDLVTDITFEQDSYKIITFGGECIAASRVLLTPGAFANCYNLIPQKLDIIIKGETVLLARVTLEEAQRLSDLPSLLYEIETNEIEGVYLIRPLLYPDGNWYLKLGCNLKSDRYFQSLEEIQEWFENGSSDTNIPILSKTLFDLIPSIKCIDFQTKRCVLTRTPTGRQYIGRITPANHDIIDGKSSRKRTISSTRNINQYSCNGDEGSNKKKTNIMRFIETSSSSSSNSSISNKARVLSADHHHDIRCHDNLAPGAGLYIATGGNGYSAMCSDEVGRIAAYVVEHGGNFPEPYDFRQFLPKWL